MSEKIVSIIGIIVVILVFGFVCLCVTDNLAGKKISAIGTIAEKNFYTTTEVENKNDKLEITTTDHFDILIKTEISTFTTNDRVLFKSTIKGDKVKVYYSQGKIWLHIIKIEKL